MYGLLCLEANICSSGQSVVKLSLLKYVRKVQPSQLRSQKEKTLTVLSQHTTIIHLWKANRNTNSLNQFEPAWQPSCAPTPESLHFG